MALTANIDGLRNDSIWALDLNVNGDTWGTDTLLPYDSFPMLVLGSDNKGGVTLQHPETEDMYYVQSLDLDYETTEETNGNTHAILI